MNSEPQIGADFLEHCDITAALMAEDEICADANTVDLANVTIERTNKDLTGLLAERVIEVEHEGGIDAKTFNGAQFLRQGVNQWRKFFRRDDGIREYIVCDEID